MAWIVLKLDNTLVHEDPMQGLMPVEGAVEAVMQLQAEGHRLTVFTSRFAPMPETEKQRVREEIETGLANLGFPPLEVWTGTTRPDADAFIGDDHVTFDQDWGLALAQTQMMLEERGLIPPPMPADAQPMEGEEMAEEAPQEEEIQ